ncbi:cyclin-dependent kinase 2-interacting protein-like [Babylonia areolata]|uniref:cyclin-dependent kinase 2-interacting protein-like n=1 Tax=Babylonia areolata TaxID=304850 RepID=UPI003FCFCC52
MAEGQFTPYKSPVAVKGAQKSGQGNLTGHVRKLKDIAAELHNTVEKWESFNGKGHLIVNDIVNVKLQFMSQQNGDTEGEEEQMTVKALSQKLEPKCQELHLILESMEVTVSKLSSLLSMVQGVQSLCVHRGDSDHVLFTSWTIHNFAETLDTLHAMYAKELSLKRQVCQHVAFADSRPSLMLHSVTWLLQPYVNSKMLVLAMLQETGHSS